MYRRFERIHFVGIGGIGMSGIAEVLKNLGYGISGSDIRESETTRRLRTLGIEITVGHRAENVKKADVVVVSSAVSQENPEVEEARSLSIPVIPRAEMLAELARIKYGILVAGAHGKTTTTSLIASLLGEGRFDPTVVIGGKLKGMGSNARLGQGEFLVAEADESDGSFLRLSPTIAVVTNIDREHMDFFKNIDEIKKAFLSFVNKVPFYGLSILCGDNEHIRELLPSVQRRFVTYGIGDDNDLIARNIRTCGFGAVFEAELNGSPLGSFELPLIGEHNVCNALAAIAVSNELQMSMEGIRKALKDFSGVQRRFELKGEAGGVRVIDDYAHHPAEIAATLKAAKEALSKGPDPSATDLVSVKSQGRLVVLFQPHRYTRTRDLLTEFFTVFVDADKVILTDIYPAGEMPIAGIDAEVLFRGIKATRANIEHLRERKEITQYLIHELREGDVLITLGAGDVWRLGEEFLHARSGGCRIQT